MQKKIFHNQSIFDIAIQNNGNVISAFELAIENGLSLTDELIPGQTIEVTTSPLIDIDLVDFFKGKKLLIATAFNGSENEDILPQLGIGAMRIGSTFIVR